MLTGVAARLTQVLRPGDTLARVGGDEFVVLCEDLSDPADAEIVARRLTTAMSTPFNLAEHRLQRASVWGSPSPAPADTSPKNCYATDFAMYRAKQNGGGRHAVIDTAARLTADRHDDLERDLRQAQHRNQLALAYQTIIDVRSRDLVAVEALLRWHHPERGTVMPDALIPSAERTGLILAIGE